MYMRSWLDRFYSRDDDVTISLKDKNYKLSECVKVGGGSEKTVYQLKGQDTCFFIPHKCSSEENWNYKIVAEKTFLDEMDELGLKTQRFEILPIEIKKPGKPSYTIQALVTTSLKSRCEKEHMVIYNRKGKGDDKVIGTPPDIVVLHDKMKDKAFTQSMLKQIASEYAICYSFNFPISVLSYLDDSEQYCLELGEADTPPVVRYMFWDVVSDYEGLVFPIVPTLKSLKKGEEGCPRKTDDTYGLYMLANGIACAINVMASQPNKDDMGLFKVMEKNILDALKDDVFLNTALIEARAVCQQRLLEIIDLINEKKPGIVKDKNYFITLMKSAISIGETSLLDAVLKLYPTSSELPPETVSEISVFAKQYENPALIDYLEAHVTKPALKQRFLKDYEASLTRDKNSVFSLYGLFSPSHVREDMTFEEIVKHAKGTTLFGGDKRSTEVLKQLGWFDNERHTTGALSTLGL